MGKVLVDFRSVVCSAALLLYKVLRPAVAQGGTVVDRPPSPDRSLPLSIARCRSPAVAPLSPLPSGGL